MLTWTHPPMLMELVALGSPFSVLLDGGQSGSLVVYGSALATVVSTLWALCERSERRSTQTLNLKLSTASQKLTEQHYRERLQAEERHLMTHDSYTRNVLDSLERAVLGKPKD